jgi:hypothetical protein
MAWTTPQHTFVTGELFTAAMGNTYISDNMTAVWPYTAAGQIGRTTSATAMAAVTPGWSPDAPPTTAGSIDDEFATVGALPGAWTEYDPDNKSTWSVVAGGLQGITATSAADNSNGIWQTIPAGDFTIWTRIAIMNLGTNFFKGGIRLWADPTGDNKQIEFDIVRDGTAQCRILMQEFTNRTTSSTVKIALATLFGGVPDAVYLRLRRTGTNYYADASVSGWGWQSLNGGSAITWSFTPAKIGIGVSNQNTGANMYLMSQFFRYVASDVGLNGVVSGGRY